MNLLTIIILLVLLVFAINGYMRGFARTQNKIIKSLPIPKELQTQLLDNNNSYTYANMAVQTFSEYISTYLADMILNMLTYFISFNLVSIALHAVARALRIMTRLPILRGVNRMCGGALGFVKGICIVWLFSPFFMRAMFFCGISSNFKIQECLCNPPEAILVGVQSFASHHLTKIKKG